MSNDPLPLGRRVENFHGWFCEAEVCRSANGRRAAATIAVDGGGRTGLFCEAHARSFVDVIEQREAEIAALLAEAADLRRRLRDALLAKYGMTPDAALQAAEIAALRAELRDAYRDGWPSGASMANWLVCNYCNGISDAHDDVGTFKHVRDCKAAPHIDGALYLPTTEGA